MQIFFSVGEPSGDLHGANLIHALRKQMPECEFVGYGGPKMAAAGCELHEDLTKLAVMWVLKVLLNIHKFLGLLKRADQYFEEHRPDAVVLIDYPGFNWWIARRAKQRGIPVFYYGTPQLWAWAEYRIKKMRRYVDHALCKLPFEEKWFRDRGCNATYVGHPYFDELRGRNIDKDFVAQQREGAGPLVTILPGSRDQEVAGNLECFLKTAEHIVAKVPEARFAIAAFNEKQTIQARRLANKSKVRVEIHTQRTGELIEAADCCLACSGSVSLELLYHAKPSVIHYHLNRFSFLVQPYLRRVRYITLVNLMTTDNPFRKRPVGIYDRNDPQDAHVLLPEYLTSTDRSGELAAHIIEWLRDESQLEKRHTELAELREQVGQGGASVRAAVYIAKALGGTDAKSTDTVSTSIANAA
ncbi:lipid-A-disaccharide synthase [Adhaeretor mobilis]|uniref:Lipid-A-disaccharide synthase n=1 Tax=Adhaeretor mobilis TaxID=1930276 RepID=A0A517N238_9BACT|nr:lipid-A-disaccharide synthase [Adhaeretor mobilis]QDT01185.1 Glycosyl transferase [Adhaeretor mobilis]